MKSLLVFLFVSIYSTPIFADASRLIEECNALLSRHGLQTLDQRASFRGFLSSTGGQTPEAAEELPRIGIMRWGLRVYLVRDEAGIHAHNQEFLHGTKTDDHGRERPRFTELEKPFLQSFYLLMGDLDFNEVRQMEPESILNQLIGQGLYYFEEDGLHQMPAEAIQQHLDLAKFRWAVSEQGDFLNAPAWVFPRRRGVILTESIFGNSTYKKLMQHWRRHAREGWKIRFNHDFAASLELAASTPRPDESRYADNATIEAMTAEFETGRAYSVEVYDPEGVLMGALIGTRSLNGNLFIGDTVAYRERGKGHINYPKYAQMALLHRLYLAGIPFMDAGMVTAFTESMKGQLVPDVRVLELFDEVSRLDTTGLLDLESDWEHPENLARPQ